jgi:hypothetical protein
VAAGLVAFAGSVWRVTGPLVADGVALALALLALAVAVAFADKPSRGRAIATGALAAAAVAVKLLVAPVGLAIVVCFLPKERRGYLGWAALSAAVVSVVCWLPFGIHNVVTQSVSYNSGAESRGDLGANADEIIEVLKVQDPTVLLLAAGCLAVALVQVALWFRRRHVEADADGPWWESIRGAEFQVGVWAWLAATVVFLLFEPTLWEHHVAIVVPPLVIAAVLLVRRPAVLAVVGLVALAMAAPEQVADVEPILAPRPYHADQQAAVDEMARLPDDAWIVTDAPGLVLAAGLSTPPDLVDPSVKRIEQEMITLDSLRQAVADPQVCGVLAWRPKFAWLVPGLPAMVEHAGFTEIREFGPITNDTMDEAGVKHRAGVNTDQETLWLRPGCD